MLMTLRMSVMVVLLTVAFFFNGCAIIQHDAEIDKKRLADDLIPAEALAHQLVPRLDKPSEWTPIEVGLAS